MHASSKTDSLDNIWIVTREYEGLAGAGGVKDVSRQLAEALAESGRSVSVALPCYGFIRPQERGFRPTGLLFPVDMPYVGIERREQVSVWSRTENRVNLYLIDSGRYREKLSVYTYTAEEEKQNPHCRQGEGHFDYFAMNVLLQKAVLDLIILLDEKPAVIHCQDGHTAVLPAMMRELEGYRCYFGQIGAVVTIHNAGHGYHQEVGDLPFARAICGLPSWVISENLLDGAFDPFLAAANYAIMNTVSENYAAELRETTLDEQTGWLGHRLLQRGIFLAGVTNGINPADFDPTKPKRYGLAAAFDPEKGQLAGKRKCRNALVKIIQTGQLAGVRQAGTLRDRKEQPLFTLIGRLTAQKGVDLLVEALKWLLPQDPDFETLILGTGSKELESSLVKMAEDPRYTGRLCVLLGYDPQLANKIYAAGDFFVIPSRYEPCGLTDYIAQLFGNLPIVHHVGGLVKVVDSKTGFAYRENDISSLAEAMSRAMQVFREQPQTIRNMQQRAVQEIRERYTWGHRVSHYLELYRASLDLKPPQRVPSS